MVTNEVQVFKSKNLTIPYGKSKVMAIDREIATYLNKDEIHRLLGVIENKSHYLLLDLLWRTGIRVTEAISIKKGDIDLYNKTLKIRWLKRRKAKERIIPLHQDLAYSLSVYTGAMNLEDRVFPITRQRCWQILVSYGLKANLGKKIHPHTLRHSFAIFFLNETGNIKVLKDLLGHSQITTTMVYLNYVKKDVAEMINRLEF